ncbi:MAG TPA: Yip1 family protein [Gemmatimonadaceae bacterium]
MTESTSAPTQGSEYTPATPNAPTPRVSFWEDLVDIFVQPAAVFRRRETASFWPPLLVVTVLMFVIMFATSGVMQPIFDAEFSRSSAELLRKNPQMTQDMLDRGRKIGEFFTRWGLLVAVPVTIFILGAISWLVGKLVASKQAFHAAMVVVAYAYMVRVLGALLSGVQGLMMDPAKLTSQYSISIGPARFLDPDTANKMLLALCSRLDVITIWLTVLLAIGIYVTGRVSKSRAAVFGVLIWLVGSLPALRQAYTMM